MVPGWLAPAASWTAIKCCKQHALLHNSSCARHQSHAWCRSCEVMRQRAKLAGHTWTDVRTAVTKGQLPLTPVPAVEAIKSTLDTMLLGKPAAKQANNGRAERAAQRERQSI